METEALPTASSFPSAFEPTAEAVEPVGGGLEVGTGAGGNLAGALGLTDTFDDEIKEKAQAVIQPKRGAKRPKMTHGLFFSDDNGLKKVLRTFPKIRFKGKGRELDDLNLLLQHYERWFKDLYPSDDHFEDMVHKARTVLQQKEAIDGDSMNQSDPKEHLHLLRFQYKSALPNLLAEPAAGSGVVITDDVRRKIEENRKKALEKKRQREAQAAAPTAEAELDDADMFGFGFGMEDDPAMADHHAAAGFDDDEDVFGFGGGLDDDDDFGPPVAKAAATATSKADSKAGSTLDPDAAKRIAENRARALAKKKQREEAAKASATIAETAAPPPGAGKHSALAATSMDEDEDVFGFGGGLDDDDFSMPSAPPVPEQAGKNEQASKELDAEKIARIEANRAKALALREQREKEKQLQTAAAQQDDALAAQAQSAAPPPLEPDDEEDVWGFGGGLDEP